jgi:hypothetical protein
VLCSVYGAEAAPILDQESAAFGRSRHGVGASVHRAQTFTVGLTGRLSLLELVVTSNNTTTGDLIVSVWGLDGDLPDSTKPYGEATFERSTISSAIQWHSFDISHLDIQVATGQRLAIVLRMSGNFGGSYSWENNWNGVDIDRYLGGGAYRKSPFSLWTNTVSQRPTDDFLFRTYVASVPEPTTGPLLLMGYLVVAYVSRRHRQSGGRYLTGRAMASKAQSDGSESRPYLTLPCTRRRRCRS